MLLVLSFFGLSTQLAYAKMWGVVTTKNTKSTNAYGSPTLGAEVVGTYPYGTVLRVFVTPQNGFYAVPIMQENKEPYYVYVSQEDAIPTSVDAATNRTIASVYKQQFDRFFEVSPQMDYLSMNFRDGSGVSLAGDLLRVGVGLTYYRIEDHLELGLAASYASAIASSTILGVQGVRASQIQANMRLGYMTHIGSLGFGVFAGVNANRFAFSGTNYGFQTLYYPEIYPRFDLKVSNRWGVRLTPKFIPLSASDPLHQRQLYTRFDVMYKASQASSSFWSFGLEYSNLLVQQRSAGTSHLTYGAFSVGLSFDL